MGLIEVRLVPPKGIVADLAGKNHFRRGWGRAAKALGSSERQCQDRVAQRCRV